MEKVHSIILLSWMMLCGSFLPTRGELGFGIGINDRDLSEGGLNEEQIQTIVDVHNELRRGEGASNMEKLRYNDELAALAQTWAEACQFEHGQPPFSANDIGFEDLGQNLFVSTDPDLKVEEAVKDWFSEKSDYDYNSRKCTPNKMCGHYTQVTWAKSTDVGCGIAFCPSIDQYENAYYIVCNYGPAGNVVLNGVKLKNFLNGEPCSKCSSGKFFCNNDLCDSTCTQDGPDCECKAPCQNCAKRTEECRCKCNPGSDGLDCSENCENKDKLCGANPGYPEEYCTSTDPTWAFMQDRCHKLCNICQVGDPCA